MVGHVEAGRTRGTERRAGRFACASGSAQRTIGLAFTGAVGIVAMAVSVLVGLAAKSKFNQALGDLRVGGSDWRQGAAENSSALSMGNAATWARHQRAVLPRRASSYG